MRSSMRRLALAGVIGWLTVTAQAAELRVWAVDSLTKALTDALPWTM